MTIKVILIDDEPLALNLLTHQLSEFRNIEIVETFTSFDLAEHSDVLQSINVVFLDIEMPGINGLNLAEQMVEVNSSLLIVFVTAYNEYAVKAFEFNALDYLLKPVTQDRLETTLERIKEQVTEQPEEHLSHSEMLHINLCRELKIFTLKNNEQIENIRWRTQKTQELFIYLLFHAGETVPKVKLAELLWPDHEQERALSQLYTAIYNIRKTLTPYKHHLTIESVYEGYTLITNSVVIDIFEWEYKVKELPPLSMGTIADYEAVMHLYTGPFLEAYKYAWADPERFRLGLLWLDYASQMADFYKGKQSIEQAIMWYEKICEYRPEDDHANFSIMKLHASLGYGILVDYQFSQYKRTIEDLGLFIDPKIGQWYNDYKMGK